jgi:PAS domain S-box-containing protein
MKPVLGITDENGIILYANENFCKISKYDSEELIGQNHRIINSGYHSQEYMRNLWKTITQGKTWKGEKNKAKMDTGSTLQLHLLSMNKEDRISMLQPN